MKKLLLALLIISTNYLITSLGYSQNVDFSASNFKDDKEGLKKAKEAIKKGDEYFEQAEELIIQMKTYGDLMDKAVNYYKQANKFNPNNAELNMKLGAALLFTNRKAEAKEYLDKAIKLDPKIDAKINLYLGMAAQLENDFSGALKYFKTFEETAKSKYVNDYQNLLAKFRKECEAGKTLIGTKLRVWVDNVKELNSEEDDYSSCISADGETIIFNSRRENGKPKTEAGYYDADVYMSTLVNKKWTKPQNLGEDFNTEKDETATALSYDGQRMLLFQTDNGQSDIYESKLEGIKWTKPVPKFPSNVNLPDANETYACYHPDYIKIYYLSDKNQGKTNFYFTGVMDRQKNLWGKASAAGMHLSSKYNEGSIYISADGETMYFSSQGHNSMGGYDIFMSKRDPNGMWGQPVNLGYPINTPYDEFSYTETANGKYAYISSNRKGGLGGMDIYKITYWGPDKPVLTDADDFLLATMLYPERDQTIEKEVAVEKKSLTVFKGTTIDAMTKKPVYALIDITDNSTGELITTVNSNSATGKFLLSLPSGKNYGIAIRADGYLFHSENVFMPSGSDFNLVDKVIELKNIAIGSKIQLRNIFFAFGKATLTPESNAELDRLVKLLNDVPTLKVEISGHTDNVGSPTFNQKLSEERANAVVQYLINKGINPSRLVAKGYGSSRPIDTNDTEAGRQNNRRTEFEIIAN